MAGVTTRAARPLRPPGGRDGGSRRRPPRRLRRPKSQWAERPASACARRQARRLVPLIRCYRSCAPLNLSHRASQRPRRGTPGTPGKVLRDGDVVGVTPWRPGGQTVVSSALSALVWTGPGSQQLLEQDLLITMPAASPFRRPGQPQTCPFGSKMVRCRAQRRGQRTLGAFHDFSRSLSGWGAPNYGISTAALRAGIFAHGHYAEQ